MCHGNALSPKNVSTRSVAISFAAHYCHSTIACILPWQEKESTKAKSIDDQIDDLHYYTTGVKFGIGRASYDAAQEIRSGDITRDEGVALVKRFDHEFPERFIDALFKYLSLPQNEFPEASKMFENSI